MIKCLILSLPSPITVHVPATLKRRRRSSEVSFRTSRSTWSVHNGEVSSSFRKSVNALMEADKSSMPRWTTVSNLSTSTSVLTAPSRATAVASTQIMTATVRSRATIDPGKNAPSATRSRTAARGAQPWRHRCRCRGRPGLSSSVRSPPGQRPLPTAAFDDRSVCGWCRSARSFLVVVVEGLSKQSRAAWRWWWWWRWWQGTTVWNTSASACKSGSGTAL